MGLYLLLSFAVVFVLVAFPLVRCAVFHPVSLMFLGIKDFILYLSRRQGNLLSTGELVGYTGLFGKGKTLTAVHHVVTAYKVYNGKKVWCPRRKKFVTQRVQVISNVALSIPYEDFQSLEQVVLAAERKQQYDDVHDTLTVTLVLGDEFSVQMNSRNYRSNIDPLLLNTILTCRHYYISIYYTAQRFCHVDALLRQVTSYIVECDKIWRFQQLKYFDAWDVENASSTKLVQPYRRSCWFVRDRDYNAYNTFACVGNLIHSMKEGQMMSEEEILKLQQNPTSSNMEGVSRPSRRWFRNRRSANWK